MFGLHKKRKREEWDFYIKSIVLVATFIVGLIYGVGHLEKFDAEQTLRSKLAADTDIKFIKKGVHTVPDSDGLYCFVSGSYVIKNIGDYPFSVETISFELHEVPVIQPNTSDRDAISYALSERLIVELEVQSSGDSAAPKFPARQVGKKIEIDVFEQYAPTNQLWRSFGFIVPMNDETRHNYLSGSNYVVVARAYAGIDNDVDGRVDNRDGFELKGTKLKFLSNDLTHMSGSMNICEAG